MANDQYSQLKTPAEHQEAVFAIGVSGVWVLDCVFIEEDTLRLLERHTVFSPIPGPLGLVPFEPHSFIIL